ncbi:MAG: LysR family transcriptional regulator [Solirubrobacteraceae bacterium]
MEAWLGVEVRHLAALEAIDRERSFRGAADRLGYVQSAVSQQLSQLERLIGTRLVERTRGHRRVALTQAGLLLLDHANKVLAQLQAAQADLEAMSSGVSATLRVGTFQSVATRIMPAVLGHLARERPALRVVATEAQTDADLFASVQEGRLDAAFGELPLEPGPFEGRELCEDPCVLVVRRNSQLGSSGEPPSLAEIVSEPLVAHPAWRMTELLDQQLGAAGLEPRYAYRSDTNTVIQAMVSAGLASAILPRLAVAEDDPAIEIIDMSDVLPVRRLALFWHRDRTYQPGLESFYAAAKNACQEMAASRRAADRSARSIGSDESVESRHWLEVSAITDLA